MATPVSKGKSTKGKRAAKSESHAKIEIDFSDPALKRNPFPLIHRLQDEDPVHYLASMDSWLVTRYDDIAALYSDERVTGDPRVWDRYDWPPVGSFRRWIDDNGLMAMDRREHSRQRKLLNSGFTPRGVQRMEGQIRDVVASYAGPLKGCTGVVDIMEHFTTPVPAAVIGAITGVSADGVGQKRFSKLAQEVIQGFFGLVTPEVSERCERAYLELSGWVKETIEARRKEPREDLISDLLAARVGDDRLSEENIVAFVSALVAAGSETTATGGMICISILLDHPEALERVRADRSLIPQTVLELLRYGFGGLLGTRRFVREDFEFRGRALKKGQMILLSGGGASHDPRHYPDPDTFDIDRNPQDVLTFGSGPHYCLGANLAKGELNCMVDAALDFLPPGAKVRKDRIETVPLGMFERVVACPIDFGAGSSAPGDQRSR